VNRTGITYARDVLAKFGRRRRRTE